VKRGGIKKKFQISALSRAAVSTGKISKVTAIRETVTSSIRATTRYPRSDEKAKQSRETAITSRRLHRN